MIRIDIPGHQCLCLHHLVLDYNGTLACDGQLINELIPLLRQLTHHLTLHVITADTHGTAEQQLAAVSPRLEVLEPQAQDLGKQRFISRLGADHCVAIGNGYNDRLMLKDAAVGLAVIGPEAAAVQAINAADVLCLSCREALELLLHPQRLVATLRR